MMKSYIDNYRLILQYYKKTLSYMAIIIPIIFVFGVPKEISELDTCIKLEYTIAVFILSFIISTLKWALRSSIDINLNGEKKIIIKSGNLFDQKDIIVIPVNRYFDTEVNDEIISPRSIHGQFVEKYYPYNIDELDRKIDEELKDKKYDIDGNRPSGKKKKYPFGTMAEIKLADKTFLLVALTDFDYAQHVIPNVLGYWQVLFKLTDYASRSTQGKLLSMTAIGTGNARVVDSTDDAVKNIIQVFKTMRPSLAANIQIIVPPKTWIGVNHDF